MEDIPNTMSEENKNEKKEKDNEIENTDKDNQKEIIDPDSYSYSTNKDSQNDIKKEKILSDINYNNLLLKNKNYQIEILDEQEKKYDLNFKIIVIGNIGVGKSCLSLKATKGIFIEEYTSTVGFEFYCFNVKINNKIVKLQIWDTCGQEAYRSLIMNFYRNSSLAIVVYSVEDKTSFNDVNIWLKQVKTYGTSSCKIFLIGNKIDSEYREVSYEQGLKCKNDFFFDCFMETSAKEGINTRELFVNCATVLYEENMNFIEQMGMTEYSSDSESIKLSLAKEENYEEIDECNC
jgi:small GTP-binding protein